MTEIHQKTQLTAFRRLS